MFNKLQFNNLVITNKKKIQQIKVQTIQKLVQKIRKRKGLQEKWPEDEKTKTRLRKTTECMEQLKALKCVDIIKRILLLEKSPAAVITNGLSSPEEIAIALLATNKTMQNLIQHFRQQLNLNEDDADWKKELMRTSKRRFKIMRTEQKRERRKELKEQKMLARKRLEWLKGNDTAEVTFGNETSKVDDDEDYVAETVETEANISTTGIWKVEKLPASKTTLFKTHNKNKQTKRKSEHNKNPQKPAKQQANIANKNSSEHEQLAEVKAVTKPMQQLESPPKSVESIELKSTTPALSSKYSNSTNLETNDKPATAEVHVVDPFFITDSGENYLSTAVITREDGPPQETQPPNKKQAVRAPSIGPMKRQRPEPWKSFKGKEQKQPAKLQKSATHNDTQNLHPSWAAKQKFKPVITGFQGKKIKFGDDAIEENGKSQSKATNANTTHDLHPSWAAKQKLKPIITDFKGKKIKFDDAELHVGNTASYNSAQLVPKSVDKQQKTTKTVASNDLHPSWAAKQKQKPAITAFQGKKIIFDADDNGA